MIIRLALAAALVATGTGLTTLATLPDAELSTLASQAGLAGTGAVPAAADPRADEVTFTEVEVVVPPVDPAGEVVESPEVVAAQADDEVVVADEAVQDGRLEGEILETEAFQTLGVTWAAGSEQGEPDVLVRTRADDTWSEWVKLEGAEATPDVGSPDEANARDGTHSLWVGEADAVQLSFAATQEGGPQDMELALIASEEPTLATSDAIIGAPSDDPTIRTVDTVQGGLLPAAGAAPAIITRAQWGAAPQVCTPDVATKLVGGVVHHTAGGNTYATVAQAMQQIRNDQKYHIEGRGWCDIGYNFVVDKWGNIYEARAGSLTQPVIGVHAGGFNTTTVGVSMLGNFQEVGTPPAMIDAVGRIMGFRLAAYNVDPQGSMNFYTTTGENSKFANQNVPLPRIFAHRDVAYTSCPGQYGYAQMDNIRAVARTYYDAVLYAQAQSVVKALYQDLLLRAPDPTGLTGWTAALLTGTSQTALVGALTSSREYVQLRVTKSYREVLGREPDAQGLENWVVSLQAGHGTVDDVQRRFYDSIEYYTTSGGTPEGYVRRLFTTMTRREATPADVVSWTALLTTKGRAFVVDSIWYSLEAASVRSGDYYLVFLGRAPDLEGQTAWAQVLLSHGEGAVRNGIAGSTEYRQRAIARFP